MIKSVMFKTLLRSPLKAMLTFLLAAAAVQVTKHKVLELLFDSITNV